jgi:hypothetical protein
MHFPAVVDIAHFGQARNLTPQLQGRRRKVLVPLSCKERG